MKKSQAPWFYCSDKKMEHDSSGHISETNYVGDSSACGVSEQRLDI